MAEPSRDPALDDPFFRVVRERHPDVDLVILPPAGTPPAAESPGTADRAAMLVRSARAAVADVLARTGREPDTLVAFWSSHGLAGSRRRVVRATVACPEPGTSVPLLRDLGDALLATGWDARPYADGSARLAGVRGELTCRARAHDDAVALEVASAPVAVSEATAGRLDREDRA